MENENNIIHNITINVNKGAQVNIANDSGIVNAAYNCDVSSESDISNILKVVTSDEYVLSTINDRIIDNRPATEADVDCLPDELIDVYKKQLGPRLQGDENKLKIVSIFLSEIEKVLKTGQRYSVMPILSSIPRADYDAYLYLDDCKMPFDKIKVQYFYWDSYERYEIEKKYYNICIGMREDNVEYCGLGYKLNFPNVEERLFGFNKVERIINSDKVTVYIPNENKSIDIKINNVWNERQEQIELTKYWIEQMKRVVEIEKHYKIKFHLPEYADENNYVTIDILHDSICNNKVTTLPAIPMEKPFMKKYIKIDEEYLINNGQNFERLELFGYQFIPVGVYMMKCTLSWNKKLHAWETSDGGVPGKVVFNCC